MRLCIVNEFFYPDSLGGTGTVLSSLARSLQGQYEDVEIDVLTSRHLYRGSALSLARREDWQGIRITRLATPKPNGLPTPLRLAANALFGGAALLTLLGRRRYDLLLVGTAPPTVACAAWAYRLLTGTPYLYIVYDLEPDRAVALRVLSAGHPFMEGLRRRQRDWLHGAAKVIVLGRCMRDHLCAAYGLDAGQVAVIPIGADPEEIRPQDKAGVFRAKHRLDGFVVCYSGNFGHYHDFDTILDAAKRLRTRRPGMTFLLVGDGAQRGHIERRVAQEGLENVRRLPFVPPAEYSDLLAAADVSLVTLEPGMDGLCVPSKFYSILASGRATVALVPPRSEVARVIVEARCGVPVLPGDTEGLIAALGRLADDPEAVACMGRNARHVLLHQYAQEHITRQYHAAMRAAVQAGPSRSESVFVARAKFS